jgi:hypothetical protein
MEAPAIIHLDSRAQYAEQLAAVIARSQRTLQLFDPDAAIFPLGNSEIDTLLRHFLAGGGTLQVALHRATHVERAYPRFLRLAQDFGHLVSVHLTARTLHQLTDSFCIGDGVHIVRRYHSDHLRGEAAFDAPLSTEISLERFGAIWLESVPGPATSTTGL